MPKKTFFIIILIILIGAAGYLVYEYMKGGTEGVFDPKNASYTIGEDSITLINGRAEKEIAPGSASKIEVIIWVRPVIADLNADEVNDAALILTYSAGGSGTFYYVAAALQDKQSGKALGTKGILLGDRISPQNISIDKGKIIVNYADRKLGEPMTNPPSVGITRTFEIKNTALAEITPESARKEQACLISGGIIETSLCCKSAEDFPNSCLIGACGCSPDNSKEVKTCKCGTDKCFDGTGCASIKEITFCTEEQRNADACLQLYDPVCAKVNIQCIRAPCDPVYETFSNACFACMNSLVESYTKGECAGIK